ncbi:unnamed protein product [Thelazia callipaeda]|uniref:BZIP domain-containing protein n=1 Tax=Thelazia callipaeda TaxID=103827 RepID=A0A0N5CZ87_THECL|nr:unnamed protein product [Thelazia callipaeda]
MMINQLERTRHANMWQFIDNGRETSRLPRSNEGIESLFNANILALEGRNCLKSFIDGVTQPLFDRQDSLLLCQQLQEQDGFDFMDQSIDLTPYLKDLRGVYDIDDKIEIVTDKDNTFECIECDSQFRGSAHTSPINYTNLTSIDPLGTSRIPVENMKVEINDDDRFGQVPEISSFKAKLEPPKTKVCLKEETVEFLPKSLKNPSEPAELTFIPTIKPRKYSWKPEAEKKNPLYRIKREKNNDAVRRSRTKAKEQQKMKDQQIIQLQDQIAAFGKVISAKDEEIVKLEGTVRGLQTENLKLRAENIRLNNKLNQAKK